MHTIIEKQLFLPLIVKKVEQKSLCFYNIRRVGAVVTTLTVGLAVAGSITAHEHEQTFVLVIYLSWYGCLCLCIVFPYPGQRRKSYWGPLK